jgi:hypothetical protein
MDRDARTERFRSTSDNRDEAVVGVRRKTAGDGTVKG